MLNKAKNLKNFTLHCADGEIGKVKDFYFDDQTWGIRYLLINTGNWLLNRQVLVSPLSILSVNNDEAYITTKLTKEQIENSPNLESEKPVSEQFQKAFHSYYEYPLYAGHVGYAGIGTVLPINPIDSFNDKHIDNYENDTEWDPHLRSTHIVSGYGIQALEDQFGHVDDFVIDLETWKIHYLEIKTTNWFQGRKVLISCNWINQISWSESLVYINLSADEINKSPEYTEETIIDRDYETKLHDHYNQNGYWIK